MFMRNTHTGFIQFQTMAAVCLVVALCICILLQMLGMPVTFMSIFTSGIMSESVLEDFSILPMLPEPEMRSRSLVQAEFYSLIHLPILIISVFHPPHT